MKLFFIMAMFYVQNVFSIIMKIIKENDMKPLNPVYVSYKEKVYRLYEFSFTTGTIGIPDQFGKVELITIPYGELKPIKGE